MRSEYIKSKKDNKRNRSFLLFIGSLKKGGAERNVALLANYLTEHGYAVRLVTFTEVTEFPLDKRVERVFIRHKRYSYSWLNIFYVYYRLMEVIWSYRPTRLVTFTRIAGLFAAATFYPRTIVRFDIYPLIGYAKYKQWQFWLFYNLPWVKYVICPAQELKEDVAPYFLRKKKLVFIPNPVPDVNIENTNNSQAPHSSPYFIIVSRLNPSKNIHHVIRTYAKSIIRDSFDLLILGDGTQREGLEKLIEELQLFGKVHLKGFVYDPYPFITHARALINASMREGFPNVLVESLQLGTPVISSLAKTGPREIISNGRNGLLFAVNDYKTLEDHLVKMGNDEQFYSLVKKNTQLGLNRYTLNKVQRNWLKVLK